MGKHGVEGRLSCVSPLHLRARFPTPEEIEDEIARRKDAPVSIGLQDDLPQLSAIAARLEPGLRRRFLRFVQQTQRRLDLEALAEAVRSGSIQRIDEVVNHELFRTGIDETFRETLRTGFLRGGEFANTELTRVGS